MANRTVLAYVDPSLDSRPNGQNIRELFAKRVIFQGDGDNLTVRNCLAMGGGTGFTSGDIGPGSSLIEYCEFAYNGMCMAGHNIYLNGDNGVFKNLTARFQKNYVHHALAGSMGFRSRVGRTIMQNNLFVDNGARHVDIICTMKGAHEFEGTWNRYKERFGQNPPADWWWATRFGYREDHEVIGNIFINTKEYNFGGLRIGGASPLDEQDWQEMSCGRYRFINNTFIHLAGTTELRGTIEAHFGIESVEMYNNVFYSNSPNIAPFWDMMDNERINAYLKAGETNDDGSSFITETDDEGESNFNTWRFGVRQVAGAFNWVSYGMANTRMPGKDGYFVYNGIPDEWTDTKHGNPGENPFVDLKNGVYELENNSTAYIYGEKVGKTADFITKTKYDELAKERKLPLWTDYRYDEKGKFIKDYESAAPWQDICFQNPSEKNVSTPPINPVSGQPGFSWKFIERNDSKQPLIGAIN
jgi:hypothetical protein